MFKQLGETVGERSATRDRETIVRRGITAG